MTRPQTTLRYPGTNLLRALVLLLACVQQPVWAHQEHEEQAFSANAHAPVPTRNDDGSLTIPLAAQTGLGLLDVTRAQVSQLQTLPARVIPDPRFSALVSAAFSATLVEPKSGFPRLGEPIGKGQVLAVMKPNLSNVELNDIKSELAIAERDRTLAQRQLDIYVQTLGHAPTNDTTPIYMRMKSDLGGAVARIKAYKTGMTFRGELRAPLAGVVGRTSMYVGRVVVPGDVLMEIVQPAHLWVSALSFDTSIHPPAQTYAYTSDKQKIELALVGKSLRLQGQALPLQYEVVQSPVKLAVGQALTLYLDSAQPQQALRVPAASVRVLGAGKARVWVQTAAERFVVREVGVQAAGQTYAIVSGLKPGERVVSAVPARLAALFSQP